MISFENEWARVSIAWYLFVWRCYGGHKVSSELLVFWCGSPYYTRYRWDAVSFITCTTDTEVPRCITVNPADPSGRYY